MTDYDKGAYEEQYYEGYYYCPYYREPFPCPYDSYNRRKLEEFPLQQAAAPKTPPPNYTPNLTDVAEPSLTTVAPESLAPCIFRFVYLWLRNGRSFWTYLVYIGNNAVSGWRYIDGRWIYFSTELRQIKNFICY